MGPSREKRLTEARWLASAFLLVQFAGRNEGMLCGLLRGLQGHKQQTAIRHLISLCAFRIPLIPDCAWSFPVAASYHHHTTTVADDETGLAP